MSIIRDNIEDLRVIDINTNDIATKADTTYVDSELATKEPADATILKQADIGTSVLAPNGNGMSITVTPSAIGSKIKEIIMDKAKAIQTLRPKAQWVLRGDDLEWLDTEPEPTDAEIQAEIIRLTEEYNATEYQRLRKAEYPPVEDYIDGMVKGDEAQVQEYIDKCLAVKAKYPKA